MGQDIHYIIRVVVFILIANSTTVIIINIIIIITNTNTKRYTSDHSSLTPSTLSSPITLFVHSHSSTHSSTHSLTHLHSLNSPGKLYMSCLLMKQVMPWSMIFLHFARILSFSASSISATFNMESTRT